MHGTCKKVRCSVKCMKKMLTLALALLGSTLAANSGLDILNQPLDWSTLLQKKLAAQGSLFRPLSQYPRDDLQALDATKAAEPQIAGVFSAAPYNVPATKLYQPLVFWNTCPFNKLGADGQTPYLKSVSLGVKSQE